MNDGSTNHHTKGVYGSPLGDAPGTPAERRKRTLARPGHLTGIIRAASALLFALALASAALEVALDLLHLFWPAALDWKVKSALPLVCIGLSYLLLQSTLPRARTNLLLSVAVGIAFILWGTEQFLGNPALVSFIDDMVVLLFVVDLSIVIHGYLQRPLL